MIYKPFFFGKTPAAPASAPCAFAQNVLPECYQDMRFDPCTGQPSAADPRTPAVLAWARAAAATAEASFLAGRA